MNNWFRLAAAIIAILYITIAFALSDVIPFNKGPDEGSNLNQIAFIAEKGRISTSLAERADEGAGANQPVLYHLFLAWLSRGLNLDLNEAPQIKIFWDSFRYRAIDVVDDKPWYLLSEDQQWPYYGRILTLHLGRWLSIIINGLTLLVTFRIALELRPQKPWLALAAAGLLAFIPTFIFMSAVLNEDALVAVTSATLLWMLIRIVKWPDRWPPYVVLGLALGVSITTKYTLILAPLEVLLVAAVVARRNGYDWRWWLKRVSVVGCCAIFATSWWFTWNIWYLNEVSTLGWVAGLAKPFFTGGSDRTLARLGYLVSGGSIGESGVPAGQSLGTFSSWLNITFLTFWVISVGGVFAGYPYVFWIVMILLSVVVFGLWRFCRTQTPEWFWVVLLIAHASIFIILPLVRFWSSRRIGETAQGRHILIPAAPAIAILLVWGLAAVVPPRWHRPVFAAVVAAFIGWSGLHLYQMTVNSPPLLPMRTVAQAAEWLPQQANARFGDSIELASYELDPQPAQGRLNLNLAWRSLAAVNENYRLRVAVLNSAGQPVSEWLGYHGAGRLPTLAWEPGDSVFDRLMLPLPNLPAGDYSVQVQLVGVNGQPLPAQPNSGDDSRLELARFSLAESSAFEFDPTGLAVWSSSGPPAELKFRYPGTISIVVASPKIDVQLADAAGQRYSPDSAAGGVFNFVIGPRWPGGEYRLQIDGQSTGPAIAVDNWWPRTFELPAEIETPLHANFADQVYLRGYSLPQKQVRPGEAFPITLYWQSPPDKAPQANFIQFNNLLDASGAPRGGYDRLPLEYYSTLLWAPGEVVVDGYAVPVDADAPPGEVYLDVGFYLVVGEAGVNLPLVVDGQMTGVTSVAIGPIEVLK